MNISNSTWKQTRQIIYLLLISLLFTLSFGSALIISDDQNSNFTAGTESNVIVANNTIVLSFTGDNTSARETNGTLTSAVFTTAFYTYWRFLNWTESAPYGEPHTNVSNTTALWHFDNVTTDSAYSNDFTTNGAVTCNQAGVFGTGCYFDGFNNSLTIANFNASEEEGTIMGWFKADSLAPHIDASPDPGAVIWRKIDAPNNEWFFINNGTNVLNLRMYSRSLSSTHALAAGRWYQFANVWNSTGLYLYINGKLNISTNGATLFENSTGNFEIGAEAINKNQFNGTIDEFVIMDRAIGASEVMDAYMRGVANVTFQVRKCHSSDCSDGVFEGAGESTGSFYNDSANGNISTHNESDVPSSLYFQYRAFLRTNDTSVSPVLSNVSVFYDNCTVPWEDINFDRETMICPGTWQINDTQGNGVLSQNDGIMVRCNNSVLLSNGTNEWEFWKLGGNRKDVQHCTIENASTSFTFEGSQIRLYNITIRGIDTGSGMGVWGQNNYQDNNLTLMKISRTKTGISWSNTHNSTIRDSYIWNVNRGIDVDGAGVNNFTNITIWNFSNDGIHTNNAGSNNNSFWYIKITNRSDGAGNALNLENSEDNYFYSCNLSDSGVWVQGGGSGFHYLYNMTDFTNVSKVITGNDLVQIEVRWWVNVTVQDQNSKPLSAATLLFANVTDDTYTTAVTDTNGRNGSITITEYIMNSSAQYYNNYTINVSRANHYNATRMVNISSSQGYVFTLNESSTPAFPQILPANNTFSQQEFSVTINVTDNEAENLTCNVTINTSTFNGGVNFTNNSAATISTNYTTGYGGEGIYNWTITCQDSYKNTNTSSYRNITVDSTSPWTNITYPSNGSSLSSTDLNVTFNWSINDTYMNNCSFTLNGGANISVNCSKGWDNVTTLKGLANNITIYANDSAGNANQTSVTFTMNSVPGNLSITSPLNKTSVLYNNLTFVWEAVNDSDNDSLNYTMQIASNDDFSTIVHTKVTNETSYSNQSLPNGTHYVRLKAYDGYENGSWNGGHQVDIVQARMSFQGPANRSVVLPGVSVTFKVQEDNRSDWITAVNLTITNDGLNSTYQMSQSGNWTYAYTVPVLLAPKELTVYAHAYNGTDLLQSINDTLTLSVTRTVGGAVGAPNISFFCPHYSYLAVNSSVNVSLKAELDTLVLYFGVNITDPDNVTYNLTVNTTTTDNLNYTRNFTFTANVTGNYTLTAYTVDVNNLTDNLSVRFEALANTDINVTTTATNMTLQDRCSGRLISSGAAINTPIPIGTYDLSVTTAKPTILFGNASILGNVTQIFDYIDYAETVTPPTSRRAIETFILTPNMTFDNASITFNYSDYNTTITDEDNVEFWKCDSLSSCTWSELTATLNTTSNVIRVNGLTSFSVFMIAESTASTTTTTTTTITTTTSTRGSGGLVKISTNEAIEVTLPSFLEMQVNEELTIPVLIKNIGESTLSTISIAVSVNGSNVSVSSDKTEFESLEAGESGTFNLKINSGDAEETVEVFTKVNSANPVTSDSAKLVVRVVKERLEVYEDEVIEKLEFVEKFFTQYPNCNEFNSIVQEARDAINKEDYAKANSLLDAALDACKQVNEIKEEITLEKIVKSGINTILIIVIFVLVTFGLYHVYDENKHYGRGKKGKKKPRKKAKKVSKKITKPKTPLE